MSTESNSAKEKRSTLAEWLRRFKTAESIASEVQRELELARWETRARNVIVEGASHSAAGRSGMQGRRRERLTAVTVQGRTPEEKVLVVRGGGPDTRVAGKVQECVGRLGNVRTHEQ